MKTKWDLTHLYNDNFDWLKDIEYLKINLDKLNTLVEESFNDAQSLKNILNYIISIYKSIEKLYCYKKRIIDLNSQDEEAKKDFNIILNLYAKYQGIENNFHKLIIEHKSEVEEYLKGDLSYYKRYIELIFRRYEHLIDDNNVFTEYQNNLKTIKEEYQQLMSSLNFGSVEIDGQTLEVTRTNFDNLMLKSNRETRKKLYEQYNEVYRQHAEQLSKLYIAKLRNDINLSQYEKYDSLLDKKLFELELKPDILENLIQCINEHLSTMHEYMEYRKTQSGLSDFQVYDLYGNNNSQDITITFDETITLAKEALSLLSDEYIRIINLMLDQGWIDVYPKENKRVMQSTSISYNGVPYILLNYVDNFASSKTTVHEIGHAVHTYLSQVTNNIEYFEFSLFLTEIVAKVNELLYYEHLSINDKYKDYREYILSNVLSTLTNSLFTQMQLTEFEHTIVKMLEHNEEVNLDTLNKVYEETFYKYNGTSIEHNEYIKYGWTKIPHLILQESYYLYQYSLGLVIASSIVKRLINLEITTVEYFDFLSLGNTLSTSDSLLQLGIDIYNNEYIESAIESLNTKLIKLKSLRK